MRLRRPILGACFAMVTMALLGGMCPTARSETLTLANVLDVSGPDVHFLSGLTYRDSSLWVGDAPVEYYYYGAGDGNDWVDGEPVRVHRVSPYDGGIYETFTIPGTDWAYAPPSGLASNGPYMYAACRASWVFGTAEFLPGGPPMAVYDFQGTEADMRATGLTHDGRYLWQGHYSPDVGHLYAINTANNQRVNDLAVDAYPFGLAWDGKYFYVSHHQPDKAGSYIAQYDRSGAKVATYDLPTALTSSRIGDLAVHGQDLYAQVLGTNSIAHLLLPPPEVGVPPLPDGVLSQSTVVQASLGYNGVSEMDQRFAETPEDLPVVATLRRSMQQSQTDLLGKARSYYDAEKVRNSLHSLAYGANHASELEADADLAVSKTIVIAPRPGLPEGMNVMANGTMTLNGMLQACRGYPEAKPVDPDLPNAEGLSAAFAVEVTRTGPGPEQQIVYGLLALLGQDDSKVEQWVRLEAMGDFNDGVGDAARDSLLIDPDFASVTLEEVEFDFQVPAVVGEPFEIIVVLHGVTYVPAGAEGLGAEVVFGEDPLLEPGYTPPTDPQGYMDDFFGGWDWELEFHVPEPACLLLLAVGAPWLVRRGKRRRC